MQRLSILFVFLLWLSFTGCQTMNPRTTGSPASTQDNVVEFRLRLNSDPPGAHAVISHGGLKRQGRQTPGVLSIRFERVEERTQMGWPRRVWRPVLPETSPWTVEEYPDAFVLRLDRLELQKDGYLNEPVSFTWRIPRNMRESDGLGLARIPVETERNLTVVMRNPSKPHFERVITLHSAQNEGRILAGGVGGATEKLLGETPLRLQIGVAPVRDEYGNILDWRLWDRDGIWALDSLGVLSLNATLETPGFDKEIFVQKPVLRIEGSRLAEHEVTLIPLRPSAPQFQFRLVLDSLPTGAGLFLLRPNGTLGQQLGVTPVEILIGIAQELQQTPSGGVAHKRWVLWAPDSVIDVEEREIGVANVFIRGVLYRDGLSPEFVQKQLIELVAGLPMPEEMTLTIPIYSPGDPRARSPETHTRPIGPTTQRTQESEIAPVADKEVSREDTSAGQTFLQKLRFRQPRR